MVELTINYPIVILETTLRRIGISPRGWLRVEEGCGRDEESTDEAVPVSDKEAAWRGGGGTYEHDGKVEGEEG